MTHAPTPSSLSLENLARQFGPFPKQNRSLERHRLAVLTLRARGATYPQIRHLLERASIHVSDTSLSRFCAKHAAELERLRLEVEQELVGLPPISETPPRISLNNPNPPPHPLASATRQPRDLRGEV